MKQEWRKAISEMRDAGYCVIAWTPDELGDTDVEYLEERLISFAHDNIITTDDRSREERGV